MSRLEARIDGMTCDGCARRVREAFERAGAEHVEVDWQRASARLDPKCANEADLRYALSDSSYRLTGLRELIGPQRPVWDRPFSAVPGRVFLLLSLKRGSSTAHVTSTC